jgi:hypothetical protein
MARCPICGGYLQYEREFLDTPAQWKCVGCTWTLYDPNFRKEEPRYFPSDSVDKRIEWQQVNPGFDLYPRSALLSSGSARAFQRVGNDPQRR